MINRAQCRAARGLLDWTQEDLAKHSGVGHNTITKFESGHTSPRHSTLVVLQTTFEKAGIQFTDEGGIGVKLTE
ncbi:MAG: helix-turn-helix domain-containing protein [Sphingomonadales bacterium]|nr:helix-turn-helix domain-containing protein [Sphingomonadales bacterium]